MNEQTSIISTAFFPDQRDREVRLINEGLEIPLTFKDFTATYNWPNMGSLRKMAYESTTNGLAQAFIKFKKRRLVLPQTLFKLLKGGKIK